MALSDYNGPERRENKRQISRFSLRYQVSGQPGSAVRTVTTTDVSSSGLGFEDSLALPIDTKIDCELVLPKLAEPLKIKGIIRRITKVESLNNYFYGMSFDMISDNDRQVLMEYVQAVSINNILRTAVKSGASDVHLVSNQPPIMRKTGELINMSDVILCSDDLKEMVLSILTPRQRKEFEDTLELDFAYSITDGMRFRGNLHSEKGNFGVAFRYIPAEIRSLEMLGMPAVMMELARKKSGLVLVTGPTGSGKTTTLAAMIDLINREKNKMIVSIEDPIEYVYACKKSIIKQREVGIDTLSFTLALKHVLRQDPNVILVGEMRDLDSISMAITAAETGHLVLSTLHTSDTVEAINRIIDVYPKEQQLQVRTMLASCLEGILTQILLPDTTGEGRVVATEVLIATPAIKNLIRTGQLAQVYGYIESGSTNNMHTLDDSILALLKNGKITKDVALSSMKNQMKIKNLIGAA